MKISKFGMIGVPYVILTLIWVLILGLTTVNETPWIHLIGVVLTAAAYWAGKKTFSTPWLVTLYSVAFWVIGVATV
jgi:hypothetical protein